MTLDTEDKNYISSMFDEKFDQKFGHYMGILREDFNHKFAILVEIGKDKPGREEVRHIVHEEVPHIVREEMKKITKLETVRV